MEPCPQPQWRVFNVNDTRGKGQSGTMSKQCAERSSPECDPENNERLAETMEEGHIISLISLSNIRSVYGHSLSACTLSREQR